MLTMDRSETPPSSFCGSFRLAPDAISADKTAIRHGRTRFPRYKPRPNGAGRGSGDVYRGADQQDAVGIVRLADREALDGISFAPMASGRFAGAAFHADDSPRQEKAPGRLPTT